MTMDRVYLQMAQEHLISHGATFAPLENLLIWQHKLRHLLKRSVEISNELRR